MIKNFSLHRIGDDHRSLPCMYERGIRPISLKLKSVHRTGKAFDERTSNLLRTIPLIYKEGCDIPHARALRGCRFVKDPLHVTPLPVTGTWIGEILSTRLSPWQEPEPMTCTGKNGLEDISLHCRYATERVNRGLFL